MKKLTILAPAAIVFAACGGNKSANVEAETDTLKSFEQEQIEASIKMHFDSIAAEFSKMEQPKFVKETKDGISLTKEEKQVKPNYLLAPAVADEATTLAEKYRIISALSVDKRIANLYEMPVEDYEKAITKLAADIDDPSFKVIDNAGSLFESSTMPWTRMAASTTSGRLLLQHLLSSSMLSARTRTSSSAPSPMRLLPT